MSQQEKVRVYHNIYWKYNHLIFFTVISCAVHGARQGKMMLGENKNVELEANLFAQNVML